MGDKTPIQWTDATWNPLAAFDREKGTRGWFCTKVSAGCTNCYAEGLNQRLGTGHPYRAKHLEEIEFRLVNLDQPIRWKRPRRVFVNSMTDLFHEAVPDELIDQVFAAMALAPHHVFQLLTKRPERMAAYCSDRSPYRRNSRGAAVLMLGGITDGIPWPLPNVWLGTSVEDQAAADERIPHLLRTPAAVRFVSCEPLLAPVTLHPWLPPYGDPDEDPREVGYPRRQTGVLSWVIVGGESGPKARPFDVAWARSILDQCQAADIPVFVKQLGADPVEAVPGKEDTRAVSQPFLGGGWTHWQLRDKKGGDPAEWPEDLRVREFPVSTTTTVEV